jgi:hypothetical protein
LPELSTASSACRLCGSVDSPRLVGLQAALVVEGTLGVVE